QLCSVPATSTAGIDTLSLPDALPIWPDPTVRLEVVGRLAIGQEDDVGALAGVLDGASVGVPRPGAGSAAAAVHQTLAAQVAIGLDRKSTRLNSSHVNISYAVFCLKKK